MSEDFYPSFGIMVVDDEPAWLRSMRIALARLADITNVLTCHDSRDVMHLLSLHEVGIVLLDLTMPYRSGEELLAEINEKYPEIIVIIVSGMNQIETAVKCMKHGAFDYLVKTTEEDRIVTVIQHAIRMIEMQRENREIRNHLLSDSLQNPEAFEGMLTINSGMRAVFRYAEAVAKSSQPILITGESGVGKGLMAAAIHRLSGCKGEMVSVNVGGLDDTMFTDTLFGHVRGAFTGAEHARSGMIEKAAGGTLFLDEIGDLSNASQVKLLRLLQEGDYFPLGSDQPKRLKARVIASTHHNLLEKQQDGTIRKDLYYRLQTHHIHLPPLRERKDDIPILLESFLEEASQTLGRQRPRAPIEAFRLLEMYDFPGNIREFRSMVYDAVVQSGAELSLESFRKVIRKGAAIAAARTEDIFETVESLPTINQAISFLVSAAMKRARGNQSVACRILGISQPALSRRLKNMQDRRTLD
jgi:DNA-binding NtrC family response regulator